jgi:uncharacterized protein involved in exopolysaccharide biosynthesis
MSCVGSPRIVLPLTPSHLQTTKPPLLQEEEMAKLRDYWVVIVKYRWTIATFLLSIVLIAALSVLLQDPVYIATATLYIDNQASDIMGVPEVST